MERGILVQSAGVMHTNAYHKEIISIMVEMREKGNMLGQQVRDIAAGYRGNSAVLQ